MDATFIEPYETYFKRLMQEIEPMLSTRGGPIIAVSVENEYGSYGMDREYIEWNAALYRSCGIDVPLYNTDGVYLGTYYRDRINTPVSFRIPAGKVRLDLLVENMGRICYGYKITDEHKGIIGCVTTNRCAGIVTNWENRSLPLRYLQIENAFAKDTTTAFPSDTTAPGLFRGTFTAFHGVDTHLRFTDTNLTKGQVWISGFAIGRYWNIGPQQTLYIPCDLLMAENRIEFLELYGGGTSPAPVFCDAAQLDGLTENAEVVLA